MSRGAPKQVIVDNGRAYRSRDFVEACARRGVEVVYQSPSSPFNKSAAERAMRAAQAKTRQAKA